MIKVEEFRKLPLYKVVPLESDLTEIAITGDPAIQEYFLLFNDNKIKLEFNDEKRIISGPVMVPNIPIYRNDSLGERFVVYDEEGVRVAAQLFMKNGLLFNREHSEDILPVDVLETYFTEEDNKWGVPAGSWIVSAKVNDNNLWEALKKNKYGFSVQFLSENQLIGIHNFKKEKMTVKEKLIEFVNTLFFEEEVPVEKVEEIVEEIAEEVAEEVIEEEVSELEAMVADLIKRVEALEASQKSIEDKVEEFGNQELPNETKDENVPSNTKTVSGAAKYFK